MCPRGRFSNIGVSGTNFGEAAADYGTFRAGFPDSFFDRLLEFGVGLPGQQLVDLGTGTGALARSFASSGCEVVGIDPDERMLLQARELDATKGVRVRYLRATAEHTGLGSSSFDVVSAGQCWHWFDRYKSTREVLRILKSAGKLVIAHFDWLPLPGNIVEATERLIEEHNPKWNLGGGRGMYPEWLPGLSKAGLEGIETFSYDVDVPYTPEAWRGRIRASAGVVALSVEGVKAFDGSLAETLSDQYPSEVLDVPHRVFAIVAVSPC
ncbi:MAG: class I SAM-dependent methyltransferase [Gammaproteobacteria bacterium]|nr:class I SAM-dependent methyltransferase [Gammaproteobacteria bacterium]